MNLAMIPMNMILETAIKHKTTDNTTEITLQINPYKKGDLGICVGLCPELFYIDEKGELAIESQHEASDLIYEKFLDAIENCPWMKIMEVVDSS